MSKRIKIETTTREDMIKYWGEENFAYLSQCWCWGLDMHDIRVFYVPIVSDKEFGHITNALEHNSWNHDKELWIYREIK